MKFISVEQLPRCCGVRELGSFSDGNYGNEDEYADDHQGDNSTTYSGETWEEILEAIKVHAIGGRETYENGGIVLQAWFVRRRRYGGYADNYDNQDLKDLVEQIPGVVHLHTGINSNSGNEISGYLWTFKQESE